ncbi:hypothetical protein BP00DRAFT_452690 [Aspergillus indologenus CBS 114.80]|uniref:Uncharacterized protein n=1 Tax=Aspergillus indologenus CBS 114.80 TaxID=1450541 RepID=A0A2V5HK75_9EURO|nr:hypothetical protein BP00DRAFT_452690 [Aspergillus indologenus CBS 114.80]
MLVAQGVDTSLPVSEKIVQTEQQQRHIDKMDSHTRHLDFVWQDGCNMYEATIYGLLDLFHDGFVQGLSPGKTS